MIYWNIMLPSIENSEWLYYNNGKQKPERLRRHRLKYPTFKGFPIGMFATLHAIAAPCTPLLKKEGRPLLFCQSLNLQHPFLAHRTSLESAFALPRSPNQYLSNPIDRGLPYRQHTWEAFSIRKPEGTMLNG